ncbi:MAG: hypothetical protein ABIO04_05580 [Ferruginibacter sp.]
MNIKTLLFVCSAAAITSCSTAYRSGQTPDDVYYSPKRVIEEDSHQERNKENVKKENLEDREVRMAVYDRRWRDFDDDYNYRYDPYHYGYSYGYYYNPYYCHYPVYFNNIVIINPKNTVPRMTNLGSYNNPSYIVSSVKTGNGSWINNPRPYNNSNNNSSMIRRILTTTNSSNNNSYTPSNNSRSYTPSSSSSSNSGSSSSGSSGRSVSRPGRGN